MTRRRGLAERTWNGSRPIVRLVTAGAVGATLLVGTSCSSQSSGERSSATSSVTTTTAGSFTTTTVETTTSLSTTTTAVASTATPTRPGGTSAPGIGPSPGWPEGVEFPSALTVTDRSVSGRVTTLTASCTGKGSTNLTDITAALNNAGYKTKWIFATADDVEAPAAVEGTSKDTKVRATIHSNADETCRQVLIAITG